MGNGYSTIDSALRQALNHYRRCLRLFPQSRFLPMLLDRLEMVRQNATPTILGTVIESLSVNVTNLIAMDALTRAPIPLWFETIYIPFKTFSNLLTVESREIAWRTQGMVLTDEIMTPLSGSLNAAMWFLDKEMGFPLEIDASGLLKNF